MRRKKKDSEMEKFGKNVRRDVYFFALSLASLTKRASQDLAMMLPDKVDGHLFGLGPRRSVDEKDKFKPKIDKSRKVERYRPGQAVSCLPIYRRNARDKFFPQNFTPYV